MVSSTISTTFISLILLLIVSNAAKYIIAVTVAYKDNVVYYYTPSELSYLGWQIL